VEACAGTEIPWVGLTHGLGWAASRFFSFWWVGLVELGSIECHGLNPISVSGFLDYLLQIQRCWSFGVRNSLVDIQFVDSTDIK